MRPAKISKTRPPYCSTTPLSQKRRWESSKWVSRISRAGVMFGRRYRDAAASEARSRPAPVTSPSHLINQPCDILFIILEHLPLATKFALSRTCRMMDSLMPYDWLAKLSEAHDLFHPPRAERRAERGTQRGFNLRWWANSRSPTRAWLRDPFLPTEIPYLRYRYELPWHSDDPRHCDRDTPKAEYFRALKIISHFMPGYYACRCGHLHRFSPNDTPLKAATTPCGVSVLLLASHVKPGNRRLVLERHHVKLALESYRLGRFDLLKPSTQEVTTESRDESRGMSTQQSVDLKVQHGCFLVRQELVVRRYHEAISYRDLTLLKTPFCAHTVGNNAAGLLRLDGATDCDGRRSVCERAPAFKSHSTTRSPILREVGRWPDVDITWLWRASEAFESPGEIFYDHCQ